MREQRGGCFLMRRVLGSCHCYPDRPWRCRAHSAGRHKARSSIRCGGENKHSTQNIKPPTPAYDRIPEDNLTCSPIYDKKKKESPFSQPSKLKYSGEDDGARSSSLQINLALLTHCMGLNTSLGLLYFPHFHLNSLCIR